MSPAQLTFPFSFVSSFTREDFVVAPCNEEAARFVDSYPGWPANAAALYGPAGSGKSHLVQAWAAQAGAVVLDAAALDDVRVHMLDLDCAYAVENVDAASPASRDHALFTLLNGARSVLLSGREHPRDWPVLLPDLASRFNAMLAFALWAPDDALLGALARKLFADRQIKVPDAVIDRMIVSLERSPSAIREFVERADARALAEKRPVSVSLIKELLP